MLQWLGKQRDNLDMTKGGPEPVWISTFSASLSSYSTFFESSFQTRSPKEKQENKAFITKAKEVPEPQYFCLCFLVLWLPLATGNPVECSAQVDTPF